MKKSIFMSLLAAVSLGMATVSCSSDNTEDEQGGSGSGKMETYTISCSFDNDTRMVLDANASPRKYKWETGDQITIFNSGGTKISTATLSDGAGTNDGTFTFSASGTPKYMTFMSGGTGGSATANGIRITIDPVQTYASTGTAIADLPIMAQGELTKIGTNTYTGTLKHKMSFIKFGTITYNGNPTALTISGTSAAKIDPKTGNITPLAATAYTNSTIPAANVTSGNMIAVFPGFDFSVAAQDEAVTTNPTIAENLIYTLNRDITVVPKTYQVEWQDPDGTVFQTDTKIWGTDITAPPAQTKTNYTFDGWAISTTPDKVAVKANASCDDAALGKSEYSADKVVMVPCWHTYKVKLYTYNAFYGTAPAGGIYAKVTAMSSSISGVSVGTNFDSGGVVPTITTKDKTATITVTTSCTYPATFTVWRGWKTNTPSVETTQPITRNYTTTFTVADYDKHNFTATYYSNDYQQDHNYVP